MGGSMDSDKMEIIKQLMEELQGAMEPDHHDFDMRLGKPKIEVMKMEGQSPDDEDDDQMGPDDDEDMSYGSDPMDRSMMMGTPEEKLKNRIMKLRG